MRCDWLGLIHSYHIPLRILTWQSLVFRPRFDSSGDLLFDAIAHSCSRAGSVRLVLRASPRQRYPAVSVTRL